MLNIDCFSYYLISLDVEDKYLIWSMDKDILEKLYLFFRSVAGQSRIILNMNTLILMMLRFNSKICPTYTCYLDGNLISLCTRFYVY